LDKNVEGVSIIKILFFIIRMKVPDTNDVVIIEKVVKYPFIKQFVNSMSQINAQDHVSNPLDLKTLIVFFQIYINSVKKLKDNCIDLTENNIYQSMENEYQIWLSDSSNYLENSNKKSLQLTLI
jgi:hypothetical protein